MEQNAYMSKDSVHYLSSHDLTWLAAQPMTRVLFNEPSSLFFFWERYENTENEYGNWSLSEPYQASHQGNNPP